ncbi:hypothetical protein J6590_081253 [Homalodisca vitripennis]|nr:hypothetical protein J6590_081251 [Homalodisca vitripennis]KAG8314952.1 hypothetical protein J6590_081253 [Homalodisca vitripennis]
MTPDFRTQVYNGIIFQMLHVGGRIKALIRDYWLLCDTVREANAFYGDQLLAVVLTTFLRTVILLSDVVIHYTQDNMTATINAGIWALGHISLLILLAYLSTNVTESVCTADIPSN